jgi:2-succinyl-6-hydroxy-2,4-cyclohexadiene-1-carboxylate synthase
MSTDPLLLLHGFGGDEADWGAVRGHLEPRAACAEQLYGHSGREESEPGSFEAEVDRLATRLRRRGPGRAHVVGYSLGGRLALGLLVRHPDLFSRATLIGAQPGLGSELLRAERRRADAVWIELLESRGLDAFLDRWQAQPLFASQVRFPDAMRARRLRLRERHDSQGLAQAMRCLGLGAMPDLGSALERITIPVQLVTGDLDDKFTAIAAEMAQRLPRAECLTLAGCGHNPLLEQPAALAALIQRYPRERSSHG